MSAPAPSLSFSPPECMQVDDYDAADLARQRLAPKSGFRLFTASLSNLRRDRTRSGGSRRSTRTSRSENANADEARAGEGDSEPTAAAPTIDAAIDLDSSAISGFREDKDTYRWATIYENQRGFTMWSTPYYSKLSLLPTDPLPFTVPSASSRRAVQPQVSLTEYPLPDGTWRWVSHRWMIDMRSDSGEVQHDGFEYNWRFRPEKWSANPGGLAGGLVRRRRWVRLMMRPAAAVHATQLLQGAGRASPARNSTYSGVSAAPSVSNDAADAEAEAVWAGDVDGDWARCRAVMRRLGRDGRKLEQWKRWLGGYYCEHAHLGHLLADGRMKKQWSDDEGPLPSQVAGAREPAAGVVRTEVPKAALDHFANVLRIHGDTLLHSFIYPDSRAKFLELLGHAGLLPEMNVPLGIGWSAADIDFWSYASGLDQTVEQDEAELEAKEQAVERAAEKAAVDEADAYADLEANAEVPSKASSVKASSVKAGSVKAGVVGSVKADSVKADSVEAVSTSVYGSIDGSVD
ncbi:hypothetical protein FIBSPDRAFT_849833 [Athelia psychrophila]|uniref:TECPR1-like DysF domain-containing protein n=1 Tax=Athelia psychrophila TaxID=1759441 RepID=A0A166U5P8_9AGAM|nr:hypothetical protein FIBSPDRAFT_849833 [Fibularhizoctonia sp. CBS 109695]